MLKIPEKIEKVLDKLCQNGFEAYIVGGCVRDMLMGKTPHDFDVTTSAKPEEVISIFEKTVPTGIKHGTVTVIIDKTPVEVTTFRTETSYTDHRRPDGVKFVSSLKEDLARRDFTVNAMAYNKKSGIQDFFGGKEDLENKTLRAVGDPDIRFNEDALRIFRLFRFASVLEFECEQNTLNSALKCAHLLENISRERIMTELSKAVMGDNLKALSPLIECKALEFLGVKKRPDFDILSKIIKKNNLRLTAFLFLSSADTVSALKLLKASNKQTDYALKFTKLCNFSNTDKRSEIKLMLSVAGEEILNDYFSFCEAKGMDMSFQKETVSDVLDKGEPYLISHLKINGDNLRKMGFEGPQIGEILNKLMSFVLEHPELNNKQDLKREILRL